MISKRIVKEEILENISLMTEDFKAFLYAVVLSSGSLVLSDKKISLSVENDDPIVLLKFIEGLKKEYNISASLNISGGEERAAFGKKNGKNEDLSKNIAEFERGKSGKNADLGENIAVFNKEKNGKNATVTDRKKPRKSLEIGEKDTASVLGELCAAEFFEGKLTGLTDGLPEKYRNFKGMKALLQAAFLKNGVIRTPDADDEGGYYAEVAFDSERLASDAAAELNKYGIKAKLLERNESYAVYIKDGESVGGFLALVQAHGSAIELQEILVMREERNNSNRRANCDSHNLDKSAEASVVQTLAIIKIAERGGLSALSDELKRTADVRLKNRTASLNELAEALGVSKSCVQHRLKRLADIAETTGD
jgi:DNA-binding protein WhiA